MLAASESGARPRLAEGFLLRLASRRPDPEGFGVCSGREYGVGRTRLALPDALDGGVEVGGGALGWRELQRARSSALFKRRGTMAPAVLSAWRKLCTVHLSVAGCPGEPKHKRTLGKEAALCEAVVMVCLGVWKGERRRHEKADGLAAGPRVGLRSSAGRYCAWRRQKAPGNRGSLSPRRNQSQTYFSRLDTTKC